ncbi:MAG: OmpA family protein [Thermodesulfobacteriota bacterium]
MKKKTDENIYAVFSDLMTGLMFIFVIALIAYMLNFNQQNTQEEQLKSDLRNHLFLKSDLMKSISRELKRFGIKHKVDNDMGVLRFTSDYLQFESGTAKLSNDQIKYLFGVSKALENVLPCYSQKENNKLFVQNCRKDTRGKIKSVLIEGHTDNTPLRKTGNSIKDNMDLSTQRAKTVLTTIVTKNLETLLNREGDMLFAIAGYGDKKPLRRHKQVKADPVNRRIDIRFLLYAPWDKK